MRILYLTGYKFFLMPDGEITSIAASVRYRILLPGKILIRMGHQIQPVTLSEEDLQNPEQTAAALHGDIAVIAKNFDDSIIPLIRCLKKKGMRILVDYCDNYFYHSILGPLYMDLAEVADQIVCNSQSMATEISRITGREASVIFDPVEGRKNEARFSPTASVKFAWYGYHSGIPYLFRCLHDWINGGLSFPIEVDIITEMNPDLAQEITGLNQTWKNRCSMKFTRWTPRAVWDAILDSDGILVPSELNKMTRTKSHNRLTEAIYGGRLAVASPLPSYLEFQDFCFLGEGARMLEEIVADKNAVERRITAGQDHIERRYLPFHAAMAWDKIFRGGEAAAPIKLNLGCGDRILPDHINVDSVPNVRGVSPDVVCDLRLLKPFADQTADEIRVLDGTNRFADADARQALKECRRILKPGGRIVVPGSAECWLIECGFRNIRQQSAGIHTKSEQEIRVVGENPRS